MWIEARADDDRLPDVACDVCEAAPADVVLRPHRNARPLNVCRDDIFAAMQANSHLSTGIFRETP